MIVRLLIPSDIPRLNEMAAKSGADLPDAADPTLACAVVVEDENGRVIAGSAVKWTPEMQFWCNREASTLESIHALRLLHEQMRPMLKAHGITRVIALIEAGLPAKFRRTLEKRFGWKKHYTSWFLV